MRQSEPALDLVLERLPATLELSLAAMALAVVVAVPAGLIAAGWRGTLIDQGAMLIALVGQSIPSGQTSKTFAVTINGDATIEANEVFYATLSNAVGATIAKSSAVGTISNDD